MDNKEHMNEVRLDTMDRRINGLTTGVAVLTHAHAQVMKIEKSVIKVIVTDERAVLPAIQTVESAGYDLRAYPRGKVVRQDRNPDGRIVKEELVLDAPLDYIVLQPGEQYMVSTGLRVWINKPGFAGFMFARSGTGSKGLVLGNGTGVIDSDYQGDLKMCLWNRSDEPITVAAGDRVAQLVIMPVMTGYDLEVVKEFEATTARGIGGFGSTGVN